MILINLLPVRFKMCTDCEKSLPTYRFGVQRGMIISICYACKVLRTNKWRAENPDRVRVHKATFYQNHREDINKKTAQWAADNPERYREQHNDWLVNNREKTRVYVQRYTRQAKQEVFDHYGHRCNRCGHVDEDVLIVDHVNNDGAAHRKVVRNAYSFYKSIKDAGFPTTFQILCRNCNWKKHLDRLNRRKGSEYRLRQLILDHYGHYCNNCKHVDDDVMSVDHVHNDGAEHRKTVRTPQALLKFIRDTNYPNTFQILCCNCNWKKHVNGGVL